MPFKMDEGTRESENYCSYCFKDGELCYKGTDLKEYQTFVYEAMLKRGMWKPKAKFFAWIIRFAPHWKK